MTNLSKNQVMILEIARQQGGIWASQAAAIYSSADAAAQALRELTLLRALIMDEKALSHFVYNEEVAKKLVVYPDGKTPSDRETGEKNNDIQERSD